MRIIVIEDEPKVAQALKQGLEGEHYDVAVETTGEEEGFFRLSAETFDLVVLDISCFPVVATGWRSSQRCANAASKRRF